MQASKGHGLTVSPAKELPDESSHFLEVRSGVADPDIRPYTGIQNVADHMKEGSGARPEMEQVSRTRQWPMEAQVSPVFGDKGQRLAESHLTEVTREIGAGGQSQVERAPEFGIDFHELVIAIAGVLAEFDHGHTVPLESIEHPSAVGLQLWVIKTLRAGTNAARGGILPHPTVHEDALAHAFLVGSEEAAATTRNEFL